MKLVWLPLAIADLTELRRYIADHDPGAAQRVAVKLRRTAGLLKHHPHLGRPSPVVGLREISVAGLPYVIPYRVTHDRVEILRVFHTAQERPGQWEIP